MFAPHSTRGPVAQLVEQLTFNQWVVGSIPTGLTNLFIGYCAMRAGWHDKHPDCGANPNW